MGTGEDSSRRSRLQIRKLRLHRPRPDDVRWLWATLDRISAPFGSNVELAPGGALALAHGVCASGG